jgi:hypothetical protein
LYYTISGAKLNFSFFLIVLILRYLIRADSLEDYNIKLISVVGRWSPEYQRYYLANIHPEVDLYSKWLADSIKYPVTENTIFHSNSCEHLNFMAAALQEFLEVPN